MFFFFKQKTAYEMLRSLVGSEMCIRDSNNDSPGRRATDRCLPDQRERQGTVQGGHRCRAERR